MSAAQVTMGGAHVPPTREASCIEKLLSVKVLLPSTVALIVLIMAVTTISLFAVNTDKAVEGVVELLHDQVQGLVESRIHAHLDQVLTINMASARALAKRPLGPPPGNQTPVADLALAAHLDSVVTNYPLIDVHYVFYRNGRVVGALANDGVTNLYAEEFYPNGLYFWAYPVGNVSAIDTNRSNPALHVAEYVGYTRPYFTTQRHDVAFDYAWTNPYMVGPLLLFTNTITMIDDSGVFQGVMGADSYITTLTAFFTTLRPTERTKVFLADPTGLLVIATHGDVLTDDGARVAVVNSSDATVATAGREMGSFPGITTTTARTSIKEGGEVWLLSYRRIEVLRASLVVGVATPEEEFLGAVRRTTTQTIVVCVAVATVGLIVIILFCVVISRALAKLERDLDAVARLEIADDDTASAHSGARGQGREQGGAMFSELQRTNESYMKLKNAIGAFRRYVPVNVVHGVLSGEILPFTSMTHCDVAVSFQDIEGFTSMCETNDATVVVSLVSEIFEKMSAIIMETEGTIDKYIGDAIMSFWEIGRTLQTPSAVCEACLSALKRSYGTAMDGPDGIVVRFRSGAHFGNALIGNFGSSTRFSYTVVGDTVNSAARMEPLNKETRTQVLASGELLEHVSDSDLLRHAMYMGKIALVGKVGMTKLYALLDEPLDDVSGAVWSDAIHQFEQADYAAAREAIENGPEALRANPAVNELLSTMDEYSLRAPPAAFAGCRRQRAK